MRWYASNKDLLKLVRNVRSIHDKTQVHDILLTWRNVYRQTSQKIYQQEKKIQIKAMKSSTLKLSKSQRKMYYTQQNENILDTLASSWSYN